MGKFVYEGSVKTEIEDRALAHLKVVIAMKLRRNESFTLSWQHPHINPTGRSTIWLNPSIPLRFVFDEPDTPPLSTTWITALANSASTTGGLCLLPEDLEN